MKTQQEIQDRITLLFAKKDELYDICLKTKEKDLVDYHYRSINSIAKELNTLLWVAGRVSSTTNY